MSASIATTAFRSSPNSVARVDLARWFYSFAAVLMLAAVMVGFERFYLHGRSFPDRPITPPIKGLVITHGVVMMGWILLFIVQPLLAA